MGTTLSSLAAAGHEGPRWRGSGRCGGAGGMWKEKPAPGAAAACQPSSPRAAPAPCCRRRGAPAGRRSSAGYFSVPSPHKTKPAPKAMNISARLMKSSNFIFPHTQCVARAAADGSALTSRLLEGHGP